MIFLNRKFTNRLFIFQMIILLAFFCIGQSFIAPIQSLSNKVGFSVVYLTPFDSYSFLQALEPIEKSRNLRILNFRYSGFVFFAFSAYTLYLLKICKLNIPQYDIHLGLFKELRRLLNPKNNGSKYKDLLLWT